ncbi:cysteine desulfurase-like protein [Bailinhaonella thermotolerans]|uniref:Cysteine desulfurase-like protein n=1 Tax=Bailinhaonella thermotolerans TaxID=1070861 RepID=A0A3A4BLF3_9ACTN|nr:cysteine desulfurase-like protein [Bailinhaonella thermotolerans]
MRRRFPGLNSDVVRLDGPSGAQAPQSVLDAMADHLRRHNANRGGAHPASLASERLVTQARRRTAAFLGADPDEVGFGLNATAINFHLSRSATRDLLPGDEIVVTRLDHEANLAPWAEAAADRGLKIRTVGVEPDTRLDMAALERAITGRTRIVAFPWANNAVGTLVDVPEVVRLAHAAGAIAWADATHYLPHGPVDASATGADVVIGSAYKFFGPHVGVFYARRRLLERWRPYQIGHAAHGHPAARFEPGTPPFESLAGLIAALDYLDDLGWRFVQEQEQALARRFLDGLPRRWRLHGLPDVPGRTATFALTLPGADPHDLAKALADRGIAAGSGDFHAPGIMNHLGLTEGALRVGFLHYNTLDEVERLLRALDQI